MIDLITLNIPSTEELRERLLSRLPNDFDKREGSIFYDICSVLAHENNIFLTELKEIFINSFGITASGKYLDYKVQEVGLERKQGVKARGIVTFSGNRGINIPHDTVVLCDNLQYITLVDSEIQENGTVDVEVEAVEIGSKYNIGANKINKLGITISGINSVTNSQAFINGVDIESDKELRSRYLIKVREPATSGNAYHYKEWALAVDGIGAVKVYPLANGAGTVKVVVIGRDGNSVNTTKLNEVKEHIDLFKPVGADVIVQNATPLNINISVRVEKNSLVEVDVIRDSFRNQLNDYISQVNLNGGNVLYGKIASILYNVPGIIDYSNLRVNNDTESITIPDTSIARLGDVIINV